MRRVTLLNPAGSVERAKPNRASRVGTVVRAVLGIPLLVIASIIAMTLVNRDALSTTDATTIALRAPTGERATALVFGAQSGIHLVRVTDSPMRLAADLTRGPLRIVALHTLQLDASNVGDPWVLHIAASGPVLQLRRDGPSVSVRTGF